MSRLTVHAPALARRATRWFHRALSVRAAILLMGWLLPRVVLAQEPQVQPPQLVSLPELVLPDGIALPEGGAVEVVIVVAADGSASVETCTDAAELCALVGDAISRAQFEPALRGDTPVAARVRLALRVAAPALDTTTQPDAAAPPDAGSGDAGPPDAGSGGAGAAATATATAADSGTDTYGARGQVQQLKQPGMRRLELAEMRDLPGAFGDPFRAVEVLPGIVPVLSGLPYFYVRGSPPAGTQYVYDGIPVPTLYHLGVGPAVIHPRMVGPIRLYSGVAPARYGRVTGGVVVGEGPTSGEHETHAELELRLLDASGYLQTDVLGGTLTVAARYGYPALLLTVFSPQLSLSYWDYQLRYNLPVSSTDRFELVALGSYDSFSQRDNLDEAVRITFHRLDPRWIHSSGSNEIGGALMLGWDQSNLGADIHVRSARLAPRAWFEHRFHGSSRLRLSADLQLLRGAMSSAISDTTNALGATDSIGGGSQSVGGVQAELTLRPWTWLELQLGARGDAWLQRAQGSDFSGAFDPRLRAIVHVSDDLDVHAAAGVVHQPAVAFIPLPGLADFANAHRLQSAIQSEAGIGWDLASALRAELQLFVHRYHDIVFSDTLQLDNRLEDLCDTSDCMGARSPVRINAWSYGMELFLRRPITESLSGFLSYTLAWSATDNVVGLPYTPTWDVRHVANLVLQWRLGAGFSAGARGFFRSGKADGAYYISDAARLARDERRLPHFFRVDLELAYAWRTSWGQMRVALEWFNATLSREPLGLSCDSQTHACNTDYLPAIFFPNLSVRGEL